MMPRKKRAKGSQVTSIDELSQTIDLKSYLGRKPTATEKQNFAELAIDAIENRTLDGNTINGGKFKKYSKAYAEFKGVTRTSVDLFLEGDMLDNINRGKSKEKKGTVFIQMKKGVETKKAFNHQTGDTLPQREFFGVTDAEAKSIASEIKEEREEPAKREKRKSSLTLDFLRGEIDKLDIEQEE